MIRFFTLLSLIIYTGMLSFAQAPQGIPYQAVARNYQGQPLANRSIKVRFSIIDSVAIGNTIYQESHSATTSNLGLFNLNVGMGTVVTGSFSGINWGVNYKFLKVELDTTTSGSSFVDLGTQQMMSVPYALYAGKASVSDNLTNSSNIIPTGGGHGQLLTICSGVPTWTIDGRCPQDPSSCGAMDIHSTAVSYNTIIDQDGNSYKTVVIGTQEWMAENLKSSHYQNGDLIPTITNAITWSGLSNSASCWYDNDSTRYECPYGKLYNWYALADSRNICPIGWHVPTNSDWNKLIAYLHSTADTNCLNCLQSTFVGGMIKSTGTYYWSSPTHSTSNSSGFSGLPGGRRTGPENTPSFDSIGSSSYWWSSTEYNNDQAIYRTLNSVNNFIYVFYYPKYLGMSARCLKN